MYWLTSASISLAYIFACLGLGLLCSRLWQKYVGGVEESADAAQPPASVASLFLAGAAFYSALWTALGLLGFLRPTALLLALALGMFGGVMCRTTLRASWEATCRALSEWKTLPSYLMIIVGCTGMLALACGVGAWILPPKGDAAAFYLVYPKIIAASGFLEPMPGPFRSFSTIGLPIELHYAALMILADDHAAKLFMFPIALSAGIFLAGIVRLCGGGRVAQVIGWAMLLSSYTFYHHIFDGKVDLAATSFGLAATYWLLLVPSLRNQATGYAVSGWFAGMATMAKFPYFLVLGIVMLVLLIWQQVINRVTGMPVLRSFIQTFRVGFLLALAATVAWIPQLLKNSVLFDAPLAPFLGFSGSDSWLDQVWFSPDVTRRILLTYPLALVFGRYPMQGGGLSFLFLIFLPFLVWLPRPICWRRSMTTAVTIAAILAVAGWMIMRPSVIAPRYILAPLLLFVPLLALAAESMFVNEPSGNLLRKGVLASILAALTASFWHLLPIPGAILAGSTQRDTACLLAAAECDSMQILRKIARPDERILIASYYPYWLLPSHLQCRDTPEELRTLPVKSGLVSWLNTNGFAYVAIDPAVAPSLADALTQEALANSTDIEELSVGLLVKLYRIHSKESSRVHCREKTPGRWHIEKDEP